MSTFTPLRTPEQTPEWRQFGKRVVSRFHANTHRLCAVCDDSMSEAMQFMLLNKVWGKAWLGHDDVAHMSCVESRLQRFLEVEDFKVCGMNWWVHAPSETFGRWRRYEIQEHGATTAHLILPAKKGTEWATLHRTSNGLLANWHLNYFTDELHGEYQAARITFGSRAPGTIEEAIAWAERLLGVYPIADR